MSVTIQTIITCDGGTKQCEGNDWRKVGSKDYCPKCWAFLNSKTS